jgi:O-antigen ligase
MAAGLMGTFSRGSWLAVLLGSVPLLFAGNGRFVVRVWGVGLATALTFDLVSGGMMRDTIARTVGDWSIEQRAGLMLAGVLTFLAHPIIGVGPGGFARSIDEFGLLVPQLQDWQPTPHNAYIQIAAEAGVIGLVAFAWFLASTLWVLMVRVRSSARSSSGEEWSFQSAVLWSFGVLCVSALLDWPFPHGTGQVAMLVIAMGCARPTAG